MKLNPNSSPETFPDDQAYDVPKALNEKARELSLDSSYHETKAEHLEDWGTSDDIIEEEKSSSIENMARIAKLKFAAFILRMKNGQ